MAGKAVDEVRKDLRRSGADLHDGLWTLRGSEWTRTEGQQQLRRELRCSISQAWTSGDAARAFSGHPDTQSLRW